METKCSGVHCRCMDEGGRCANMHWYHCKDCNPDAYEKGAARPPSLSATDLEREINAFVRDVTSVEYMAKSEVHRRVDELLSLHKSELAEKIEKKVPKYYIPGLDPSAEEVQIKKGFNACRSRILAIMEEF